MDMDIDSPETLIKCLRIRRHYYVELRNHPNHYRFYHCMLCKELNVDVESLVGHLKSDAHKKNLNLAKLTLLKRNINRWPFNDGVLLFDSSIKEEDMSYREKQEAFKNDSQGFKTFKDCLKAIDDDDDLAIEKFEYDPEIVNPRVKAYSSCFLIPAHGDTLKIGKSQIFGRYSSNEEIEKIWCEWIGKDDNDLTSVEVKDDDLIRVVIMRYGRGIANSYCGMCNKIFLDGRDVASLLEDPGTSFGKIVCCNSRARNKSSKSVFHSFHTSCLLQWILWCEYAQTMEVEGVKDIVNLFCPDCNSTGENGVECYSKFEMDTVKSKILEAKNEWTKNPERLQNSSIGLHFPLQTEDTEKEVKFLKLVQFYRAEYDPSYLTKVEASMT
ncbi:uncharacterized protein LOC123924479 [Trifolium pratense]|uniref:uncharacterized protein LOC123924479 n=1 Tax=Trifolium pratense TaxID=57577 RepID=UPI001E696603|nr:uncharacterized protein LOC123924479 [Trifolium pratense]XP_045833338.1 uncharacterized protein LOC123924479 [Trifolium pratense]XP_045833339.1 uncharacterized protein LOC123924479 [Trifolium pratense]